MRSVQLHQPVDLSVRELRQLDETTQDRLRDAVATAVPVLRLKRTGQRPHAFNGVTVATVCGVTPALPFWYELNVHRTIIGSYVSDIRLFHKSPDHVDLFWVEEHEGLDTAIAWLEQYDPVGDLVAPQEMAARSASPAELALHTARLQLQVDQITQHFRSLVGDLLYALTPNE